MRFKIEQFPSRDKRIKVYYDISVLLHRDVAKLHEFALLKLLNSKNILIVETN